jgi:nicotinamidase-related amidase
MESFVAALSELIAPASTAVLTMEVQRAVVGDQAALPALATEVAESGMISRLSELCTAARAAGARVVHCTAAFRPDGAGSKSNARILAASRKGAGDRMNIGSPGVELVPDLGPDPADIVLQRVHGLTPFTSTALDQTLRNLGITTVIATGVSLNVGVLGMVLSAVDLGYQVVVPRDAVAAIPPSYADPLFDNTISMLATVCTTADIEEVWRD